MDLAAAAAAAEQRRRDMAAALHAVHEAETAVRSLEQGIAESREALRACNFSHARTVATLADQLLRDRARFRDEAAVQTARTTLSAAVEALHSQGTADGSCRCGQLLVLTALRA